MISSYCDMMTNQWFKEIWIEALRSGDYEQGRGALRIGDNYCCLGVAVEVYRKLFPDRLDVNHKERHCKCDTCQGISDPLMVTYNGQAYDLPPEVSSYMGLKSTNPIVNGIKLADWNDTKRKTLAEIADMIEEYL